MPLTDPGSESISSEKGCAIFSWSLIIGVGKSLVDDEEIKKPQLLVGDPDYSGLVRRPQRPARGRTTSAKRQEMFKEKITYP